MAKPFRFELVSPERLLIAKPAKHVVVPGGEGDFGVLPGHAPLVSTLRPGVLEIHLENGVHQRMFVRSGFAEVDPESLTVLAQRPIDLDKVDRGTIAREIKDLEDDLADAKTDEARAHANMALERLRQIEAAL